MKITLSNHSYASLEEHSRPLPWQQDRLYICLISISLLLAGLAALIFLIDGTGSFMAPIPWFVPVFQGFSALASFAIAFLALGRYPVLRDAPSYWIGVGLGSVGIDMVFYTLAWMRAFPGEQTIFGRPQNLPGWLAIFALASFTVFFWVSNISHWPGWSKNGSQEQKPLPGNRWLASAAAWFCGTLFICFSIVGLEPNFPLAVDSRGVFTPLSLVICSVLFCLCAIGSVLSTRRYRDTGEHLAGFSAIAQVLVSFIILTVLIGEKRTDIWFYVRQVVEAAGFVLLMFCLLSDYVELFRRERESQIRYRQITESLPQLVWTTTRDGICDYVSPQWVQYTGIPAEQGLGYGWLEQIYPEDRERVMQGWNRSIVTGHPLDIEYRIRKSNGGFCWFRTLAVPLRDNLGQIDRWFGSCTLIQDQVDLASERERLIFENQSQRALLDSIFEVDPAGLAVVTGPDLEFAYVNPAYRYSIPNLEVDPIGKPYRMIWPEEIEYAKLADLEQVLQTGKPFQHNHIVRQFPDGAQRIFTLKARRIFWGGQPAALLTVWDVTEMKMAEKALLESESRLKDILENTRESFVSMDRDWRITHLNHNFEGAVGQEARDLLGKNFWESLPRYTGTRTEEVYRKVMAERKPASFEGKGQYAQNSYYLISVYPTLEGIAVFATDRTIEKKALEQAQASQKTLEALMEYIPEGIMIVEGPEATIRMVSRFGQEMLGGPQSEGTIEQVANQWTVYHPDGMTPLSAEEMLHVRATRKGEVIKGEDLAYMNPEGKKLYFSCTAGPIRDEAGRITGGIIAWRDISERKQAEDALRQSEALLEAFFANSPGILNIKDDELRYLKTDRSTPAFFGIDGQSIVGKSVEELVPELASRLGPMMRRVIETGQPELNQEIHSPVPGQPGEVASWLANYFPVPLTGGKTGVGVIGVEITERKKIEQALAESEQRFRSVLENSLDVAYRRDLQRDCYDYMSPVVEQVLGYSVEEMAAIPIAQAIEYVHPEDRAALQKDLDQAMRSGKGRLRYRFRTRQGEYRWMADNIFITYDRARKPLFITGILRDITGIQQAQANLRKADMEIEVQRRLLELREQERLRIARDLHDGPVQELIGAVYALKGMEYSLKDHPDLIGQLTEVQDSVNRQVAVLRDFAGELRPPALAKFGLVKGISEHLDNFREKHPEIDVKFTHRGLDGELVPEMQRLALYRIYQEAMMNILKHAQASQISIHLKKDSGKATLEIVDNGKGFEVPEEWLELIRQGHLGLAGMRERAEAIGGSMVITSKPGKGTRIRVTAPL